MSRTYPFLLDPLPYDYDGLEPVIDKETMSIHHDKHHQAYVDNLNKALETNQGLQAKELEELLFSDIPAVKNNAGGVWNHDFFWKVMCSGGKQMSDAFRRMIGDTFGSVDEFVRIFEAAALGRFGSGWAWLVQNADGGLEILSTANQDNPMIDGFRPLLALDVWEHSYYLKYRNKRVDYVKAWWQVVDWEYVESLLSK